MIARKFYLALAAGTLIAGTALAQGALVEVNDNVQVPQFSAIADDVDDWDVYDAQGTEIGEVEEVLGTDPNTPTALAVDFDGNGGYADRDVIVPIDQFSQENGRLILRADAAAVTQMETWND